MAVTGAILGDIAGSQYEHRRPRDLDYKNCEIFTKDCHYTDDTVMTLAVKKALQHSLDIAETLQELGRKHPGAGFGWNFYEWLFSDNPQPYGSYGNGSAMRASFVGEFFENPEDVAEKAKETAAVSHNHPEGIKGAQAVAAAIFLARHNESKESIRAYIQHVFRYNLDRTCDELRPSYKFEVSCQESVPQSIIAFLDSKNYEDAIRLAISMGGDADTMACITGGIAAAFYKEIPEEIYSFCMDKLPGELRKKLMSLQ